MSTKKLTSVFKLWVEWELGQDDVVFVSEDAALAWLEDRLPDAGIEDSVEELLDENLCGVELVTIVY